MAKKILIPIPSTDFDPTEVAVSWKILSEKGIAITFATPNGKPANGDPRMLTGKGLGILAPLLMADANGITAYNEMTKSSEFLNPLKWVDLQSKDFDGIVLPGGHAQGMKEYLESSLLQKLIVEFFLANKLIGAICHGTVLAARSTKPDGKSVLFGRKTTSLLKSQELAAWSLTCLWLKNYYRTYPETVQSEVTRSLANPDDFKAGPNSLKRDSLDHLEYGFVVEYKNYISARWPGDAHQFATKIADYLASGFSS